MYSFKNDYSEGAHPNILKKLIDTNFEQHVGYGEDTYSLEAKAMLRQYMNNPEADIYFVSGGTQANLTVISSLLRDHEAVISAKSAHIFVHETGAIEATGHRVIAVDTQYGKLKPSDLSKVNEAFQMRPHVVKPKLVYISNTTEFGTIYTKSELVALSDYCRANGLFLYMDGARLGQALMATTNDLTFQDIAELTDVFYIGGTKNGALLGEAIVFNNGFSGSEFDYILKQKGALLSKGRLLGVQFYELFKDGLFFDLAKRANQLADQIARALEQKGYSFYMPPESNQLFPILPKAMAVHLGKKYQFFEWSSYDENNIVVRLVTSWATDEKRVEEFVIDIIDY